MAGAGSKGSGRGEIRGNKVSWSQWRQHKR